MAHLGGYLDKFVRYYHERLSHRLMEREIDAIRHKPMMMVIYKPLPIRLYEKIII